MKIAVQTGGILDRFGIDEGFRVIKEAGFDAVDFNIDHCLKGYNIVNNICQSVLDAPVDEILERTRPYKEAAEKYGIAFYQAHAPFPFYADGKTEMNEYLFGIMEKCCAICDYVDCRLLIVHPSFNGYDKWLEHDEEWNLNIERYSRLIPALKKYNITCCLENMFVSRDGKIYGAVCSDMYEAAAYIDELNGIAGEKKFAFCFDTGHALLIGKDVYNALLQIGERVEAFHIHDNDGMRDQHIMPYTGKLDWNRFIAGAKAIGFKGTLSFETFNVTNTFDPELIPDALKLIAATGRMFARRIEE